MLEAARIFVSHSSVDRALTRELCERLRAQSGAGQGFDVLVDDTELAAGIPWPVQLHEWMANCHAAVILLTHAAVASPWVLKEATILAWRLSIDPSFRLFTVQFPDVTDEILREAKFEPLMLGQIQRIGALNADAISAVVRASFDNLKIARTPLDTLVANLASLLSRVDEQKLEEISERINVAKPAWRPGKDKSRQHAEVIARRIVCEQLGNYDGVDKLVDDLIQTTSAEVVQKILWIVAPYWVSGEAAGRLAAVGHRLSSRAAAINGREVMDFTADMYVRRAHPLTRLYNVVSLAGGAAGDLATHIIDEVCRWYRKSRNKRGSNEEIIAQLSKEPPGLNYIVVPPPLPLPDDVRRLIALFPKLKFIFWTGDLLERDVEFAEVEWLSPPLDLDMEERQYRSYYYAIQAIRSESRVWQD
jgi:hypothetical protein